MIKKLTALLIIMAMTVMVLPVVASASASETALLANFDTDSLELENGDDIFTNYTGASSTANKVYFKYNSSNYFLRLQRTASTTVTCTAFDDDNSSGQSAKISFKESSSTTSMQFCFLQNDLKHNYNDASIAARTSNVALSFDVKIPSGLSLRLSVNGLTSTATAYNDGTYLSSGSTLLETVSATSNSLKTYSYTKDTTTSTTVTHSDTAFARNKFVNFKVIFNYDAGTYDLYVDNYLVSSGNGLNRTKFLSDFLIYMGHAASIGEVDAYIDNLSYRVLTDADLSQVYLAGSTANGTLTLNESFTEVGKPITFKATPDAGCKLTSVTLDGKEIDGLTVSPAGGTYTIESLPYGGELKGEFAVKRTTALKADFDVDSLELEADSVIANKTSFTLNGSGSFLYVTTNGNCSVTVDGTDNQVLKIFGASGAYSAGTVTMLRNDVNNNRTTTQKELRTNDIAISFDVKLCTGTCLEVSAMGLPSTATISKNASGYWVTDADPDTSVTPSFLTSTILACGRSGTGGNTYSYTKDTTADPQKKYVDKIVTRDEYVNYKIIFDYDQGTYDVYKNNELIAEDNGLAGTQYLSDFKISLHHQSGYSDAYDIEAYLDNIRLYSIAEEDIKIQPNVAKSGNGTVSADKDIVSEGDNVSYTITPADGGYLRNVSLDGNPIPAFSSSGITYTIPSVTSRRNLSVSFGNYTDGSPVVMISPLAVVQNDTTYLFCKLLLNNTSVSEYGILLSRTSEIPALNDSETKKMPFFGNKDANGYFGFALKNTSEESSSFYARPYAKIGDDYVFGVVEYIEPDNLESL